MDLCALARFAFVMADGTIGDSPPQPARPGSWPLIYTLCCVLAVIVMALLYWFSSHFNVRMPN